VRYKGNGGGKTKITGEKKKILMVTIWKTRCKSGKEGDSKEEER